MCTYEAASCTRAAVGDGVDTLVGWGRGKDCSTSQQLHAFFAALDTTALHPERWMVCKVLARSEQKPSSMYLTLLSEDKATAVKLAEPWRKLYMRETVE